eukprot:jgi/Mesen1/5437/ME000270S04606
MQGSTVGSTSGANGRDNGDWGTPPPPSFASHGRQKYTSLLSNILPSGFLSLGSFLTGAKGPKLKASPRQLHPPAPRHGSANDIAASGYAPPASPRALAIRIAYVALIVVMALYASIALERVTRSMVSARSGIVPQQAQAILSLLGTGHMGKALPDLPVRTGPPVEVPDDPAGWATLPITQTIPVVLVTGSVPHDRHHPTLQVLKQLNDEVYIIGPSPNQSHIAGLGVIAESKDDYNETSLWFHMKVGPARQDTLRWWLLKDFMERHNLSRVLYLGSEVMLYANITEYAAWALPNASVALPMRWPSMRPPPLPSQYESTAVSGHVALWTYEALCDFLKFYLVVVEEELFGSKREAGVRPIQQKEYGDMTLLAWYTYSDCWLHDAEPACMAEDRIGITPERARRLRAKFTPKFAVDSLCQPRMCQNSTWSDHGLCVFDNNFSILSPTRLFIFPQGSKCPLSKHYEHYEAWLGTPQIKPIQSTVLACRAIGETI